MPAPRPSAQARSSAISCRAAASACRNTRCRRRSASSRRWTFPPPERWPDIMAEIMRNIILTGGSRGLGLGIARQLAAAGYRVIAVARKRNKALDAVIAEVARAGQGGLHFVAFDLADIKAIPDLIQSIRKEFGPIYGLINNAAIGTDGALAIMHNSQIEELIRVNTVSPIVLTKYAVRSMLSEGHGRIVNVASIIGFTGYSGLSVYGATKASM